MVVTVSASLSLLLFGIIDIPLAIPYIYNKV